MGIEFHGITPYLYYEDAAAALDWLAATFGFTETARYRDADGVVRESEMRLGDTTIQLNGQDPGFWADRGGTGPAGVLLIVHVSDVDEHHAHVVAAGVDAPAPVDKPYGARTYEVTDPGGHRWSFWQRLDAQTSLPPGWSPG